MVEAVLGVAELTVRTVDRLGFLAPVVAVAGRFFARFQARVDVQALREQTTATVGVIQDVKLKRHHNPPSN
jgi:hypothetical protein